MGFKVGDRVRLIDNSAYTDFCLGMSGSVAGGGSAGIIYVRWDEHPGRIAMYQHEIKSVLNETPVDVSAPSVEDELADQFQRARDSWSSTVKLFRMNPDEKCHRCFKCGVAVREHSRRELLIADLLVDAHTTDDVLTILSEFRLI